MQQTKIWESSGVDGDVEEWSDQVLHVEPSSGSQGRILMRREARLADRVLETKREKDTGNERVPSSTSDRE
jgi:hypothetical protein